MNIEKVQLKDLYGCVVGGELEILSMENPSDRDGWSRPMVIVVPGGAYERVSRREGAPIAADFFARGFQVCVLKYLCYPQGAKYPEQLYELACAVDYIVRNASRFAVDSDAIYAVGFSAGGHLVADYSDERHTLRARTGVDLETRIRGVGLAYPVIDEHDGSFENLLRGYPEKEKTGLKEALKLSARVNAATPPTFLWTTATDRLVPAANTLRYALALAEQGIPYELHVYPKGGHGMANGSPEINDDLDAAAILSAWIEDMCRFFRDLR